jgi:hypothetical protein
VTFLSRSGLPSGTLAQIWELADLTKKGSLTKQMFRIAAHLVYMAMRHEQLPTEITGTFIEHMYSGMPSAGAVPTNPFLVPQLPVIEPYWGHQGLLKHY